MESILDNFLNIFGGDEARNNIEKVLIQAGYGDEVGFSYWSKDTYEFLGCIFKSKKYYEFKEHRALIAEMETYISANRNDDTLIKVYVSRILDKLEDVVEYYFPKPGSRKVYYEIAQRMHYPTMFKRPYQKMYDELRDIADQEIEDMYEDQVVFQDDLERAKDERFDDFLSEYDLEGDKEDLDIINRISWEIRRFAIALEGLLLHYETKYDLFDYQSFFNIVLIKGLRYYEFCNCLGWSRGLSMYNLKNRYKCSNSSFCGVQIDDDNWHPYPIDSEGKAITNHEKDESVDMTTIAVPGNRLSEVIDQLCFQLLADEYVEKSIDGAKWIFRAKNVLYSYMCLKISERMSYENIPWDMFLSRVKVKGKKSYLKKLATQIRKGRKPSKTIVIDEAIKALKFK